ncbi:MAG: hypothetical protein NVSMB9_01470 [Isosphaeraceae bacterium]
MTWSWTPNRRVDPELMDAPGLSTAEVTDAYSVLRQVNRRLGNLRTAHRELDRALIEDGPWADGSSISLLDVGSGSGDIPRALCERLSLDTVRGEAWVLDRDPTAVSLARGSGLIVVRGDALHLPFANRSFDFVAAVKFAHHFEGCKLTRLLTEMARVARHRVVVLDLQRHWLAYYGFIIWSRIFTKNRLVRHDGPLSVLRGFTARELESLGAEVPAFQWTVRTYLGFQLALVGRRGDRPGRSTSDD